MEQQEQQAPEQEVTTEAQEVSDKDVRKSDDDTDTFPRSHVEKLRKESARYRERAQKADERSQALQVALVRLDGRLADPEDLPFNEDYLDNPEALATAIDDLIARKPGLKARQVAGDVGAGVRGSATSQQPDLVSFIRGVSSL